MADVSISIDVPSLDEGERFYCDALDCVFVRDDSADVRVLDAGNVRIYLLQRQAGSLPFPTSPEARGYARHWTPIHLDFGVDALEPASQKVVAAGGTVEGDAAAGGTIAFCADPFGNGFCLIKTG